MLSMSVTPIYMYCFLAVIVDGAIREFDIQMTGYSPSQSDPYVTITVKAPRGYLVGFKPFSQASRVHHMMMEGCTEVKEPLGFNPTDNICDSSKPKTFVYSWAKNADDFILPEQVSHSMGHPGDKIQYLVLTFHYVGPFKGNVKDYSGITLLVSDTPTKYGAVEYLLASNDAIRAGSLESFVNVSCQYTGPVELIPFAFRVHTHELGRVVSSVIRQNGQWKMVGKRHPLWPQIFEPIPKSKQRDLAIKPNDVIATTCLYNTTGLIDDMQMGDTNAAEMCNLQVLFYYLNGGNAPFKSNGYCYRNNFASEMDSLAFDLRSLPENEALLMMAQGSATQIGVGEGFDVATIDIPNAVDVEGMQNVEYSSDSTTLSYKICNQSLVAKYINSKPLQILHKVVDLDKYQFAILHGDVVKTIKGTTEKQVLNLKVNYDLVRAVDLLYHADFGLIIVSETSRCRISKSCPTAKLFPDIILFIVPLQHTEYLRIQYSIELEALCKQPIIRTTRKYFLQYCNGMIRVWPLFTGQVNESEQHVRTHHHHRGHTH